MKLLAGIVLSMFVFIFFNCSKPKVSSISLEQGWKFKKGDHLEWAKPDFDDSDWTPINPGRLWEEQGFEDYDGYAWYRIQVVIPSQLKKQAFLKDSLQILLGKIDDTEQTFLNGRLIGQNAQIVPLKRADSPGKFEGNREAYSWDRRYVLPADDERILWDQVNCIAIRVHDHGGGGGLYSPVHHISMLDIKDYVQIDVLASPFRSTEGQNYAKKIILNNNSREHEFLGEFNIQVIQDQTGKKVFEKTYNVKLIYGRNYDFDFNFTSSLDAPCTAFYTFTEEASKVKLVKRQEIPYLLTPPPPTTPRINGPKVFGVRPGAPFLFRIPTTGERPIVFGAENLPTTLVLNPSTGIITGEINETGEHSVLLTAENSHGNTSREFRIVVGDKIALTPPLGWNSWNCWGLSVSDEKVRQTIDFMESTDLVNHGWTYINIDDGWEAPERDFAGRIVPNEKFPDMKALADYAHSKGLKLGIYSSPGPLTCGGYLGSYQHEQQDAQTYARWGIDYLKYDWCSYNNIAPNHSLEELQKPYLLMRERLNQVPRDIVYSLCQYGWGNVWEWGADVGGNLWRTTGDITDTWHSMTQIGFEQTVQWQYARPGHWNDPDMLVVGWVGWGPRLHPTQLSANEQYTHISLWCLLSAPLLLGCDLSKIDDFTLNLLTNDEVLAVNQDPAGNQARQIVVQDSTQVWAKTLEDESRAVGLFNLGSESKKVKVTWTDLEIQGKQQVRDLWRQRDLGVYETEFEACVPIHGTVLIKITPERDQK